MFPLKFTRGHFFPDHGARSWVSQRSRVGRMQGVTGLSREKWMCWGAIGVAGLLALLFLLDLFLEFPFGGISPTVDILGLVSCAILGYLGWDTLREQI